MKRRPPTKDEIPKFQLSSDILPDRTDHVWIKTQEDIEGVFQDTGYKCLLCGAFTPTTPPSFPTPKDWYPQRYEKLTDFEKGLCRMRLKQN